MASEDDDRPKRSWREIDAMREKSGQRRDERASPSGRGERSQAYRSYKTQLNRLFDGGALPEALGGKLEESGIAREAKQKKELAAVVVAAKSTTAMQSALAQYQAAFGPPDEEEVLATLLGTDNEAMVLEAIAGIGRLQSDGRLKRGASLKARIKTAQMTVDSPRVKDAATKLLSRL